jgi:hypothetical protein
MPSLSISPQKKRRLSLIEKGLCPICGQRPPDHPRQKCVRCHAKQNAGLRDRRRSLIEAGLCVGCGRMPPVRPGRSCAVCIARHRAYSLQCKQRLRDRATRDGLCTRCGKVPVQTGFRQCEPCRRKHGPREAARKRCNRVRNNARGTCSNCGRPPLPGSKLCAKHREWNRRGGKLHCMRLKREVINAYGGRCLCPGCTVTDIRFLTIDHTEGNGAEHRRKTGVGGGIRFYRWLKQQGFPSGYQALCWNCNCGRAYNDGICPHLNSASINVPGEEEVPP